MAMQILMIKEGVDFESLFVNHGTDWPETYHYFDFFQDWLKREGHRPITVLKPEVEGFQVLYDFLKHWKIVPTMKHRTCTGKFKVRPVYKHVDKPCFMMIGIDAGESKRAKIATRKGIENRWPLIEYDIDREGCKEIIKAAGIPVPKKSGCYICPFQRVGQWKELRRVHPDLFCKAQRLEKLNMENNRKQGKRAYTLRSNGKSLGSVIDEKQIPIWEEDRYPPCECGL